MLKHPCCFILFTALSPPDCHHSSLGTRAWQLCQGHVLAENHAKTRDDISPGVIAVELEIHLDLERWVLRVTPTHPHTLIGCNKHKHTTDAVANLAIYHLAYSAAQHPPICSKLGSAKSTCLSRWPRLNSFAHFCCWEIEALHTLLWLGQCHVKLSAFESERFYSGDWGDFELREDWMQWHRSDIRAVPCSFVTQEWVAVLLHRLD